MLRRAVQADVPAIAALYRASQWGNLPTLPDIHSPGEDWPSSAARWSRTRRSG
jgi:hypothetical protein